VYSGGFGLGLGCGGRVGVGVGVGAQGRTGARLSRGWRDDWMDSGGGARRKFFAFVALFGCLPDLILIPIVFSIL
jgi:hypothetical protein